MQKELNLRELQEEWKHYCNEIAVTPKLAILKEGYLNSLKEELYNLKTILNSCTNINGTYFSTYLEGEDKNNPKGIKYTFKEAKKLCNKYWELPTMKELNNYIEYSNTLFNTNLNIEKFHTIDNFNISTCKLNVIMVLKYNIISNRMVQIHYLLKNPNIL